MACDRISSVIVAKLSQLCGQPSAFKLNFEGAPLGSKAWKMCMILDRSDIEANDKIVQGAPPGPQTAGKQTGLGCLTPSAAALEPPVAQWIGSGVAWRLCTMGVTRPDDLVEMHCNRPF